MNKEQTQGKAEQITGKIKETWGKLTDNDIALLKGNRQEFYGKLEKQYGIAKEEAERQIKEFEKACNRSTDQAA